MRSIRSKIIALTCAVALLTTLFLTVLSLYQVQAGDKRSLDELSHTMNADYDEMIHSQVQMAVSMLQASYDASVKLGLSDAEARKRAADLLRKLTYGQDGYFWADTQEGVNVVFLGRPDEGKSRNDAADSRGNKYVQLIRTAALNGGGYTEYWFPRPGETEPKEKRAYSQLFEPFGWIVGTGNYIDDIAALLSAKQKEMDRELVRSQSMLSGLGILLLLLAAGIAYLIGSRIASPIRRMTDAIREIGQLRFHNPEGLTVLQKQRDETGRMAASLQEMSVSIGTTVQRINAVTLELSAHAEELSASATENKQAAGQVATTIGEMAESNEHQAEDAARNNEVLHEFTDHVNRIYRQTTDGAELAAGALRTVEEGRGLLDKQGIQVKENLAIAKEADASMNELAGMMHRMDEIIALIRSIADQTHLLSLNAAIEAARAGSEGRGFAVVSLEIRKLAESASRATEEIGGHIRSTLDKTEQTAVRIRQAHQLAVQQKEELAATDGKFESIYHSADDIVRSSADISASLQNLREIAQGILERSQNQAAASEESAAAMQEISASAEEQAASQENLVHAAGQLAEMAEQLAEEMGKFTV